MNLVSIAFNNIKRKKGKILFLIAGLTIGVATVITLTGITSAMKEDIEKKLDEYGANIVISPKSEELSLSYGGISVGSLSFDQKHITESDADKIKTIPNKQNINIVSPKVIGAVNVGESKVLMVGLDLKKELAIKKWWKIDGKESLKDGEILAGNDVVKKFNLKKGDEVNISGRTFNVSSLLSETGGPEDSAIFTSLASAQNAMKKPHQISLIEVSAYCKDCPVDDMVSQISKVIPSAKVSALRQVVEGKMETMHHFEKFTLGVSLVVVIIGSLFVFVTMMGSVNERFREIGIFRAIGFRKSAVMKIIFAEAFILSVVSGIIGYGIGILGGHILTPYIVHGYSQGISFHPFVLLFAIVSSAIIGISASIYPAKKAAELDPSEALRSL